MANCSASSRTIKIPLLTAKCGLYNKKGPRIRSLNAIFSSEWPLGGEGGVVGCLIGMISPAVVVVDFGVFWPLFGR